MLLNKTKAYSNMLPIAVALGIGFQCLLGAVYGSQTKHYKMRRINPDDFTESNVAVSAWSSESYCALEAMRLSHGGENAFHYNSNSKSCQLGTIDVAAVEPAFGGLVIYALEGKCKVNINDGIWA